MTNYDRPDVNVSNLNADPYTDLCQQVRIAFACYAIDKFFPTASTKEKLSKFVLLFPCLQGDRGKLKKWAEWGNLIPRGPGEVSIS